MPNIATILKGEITRLSNKSAREHVAPLQKSSTQARKEIAALRKQVQELQRDLATMKKLVGRANPPAETEESLALRFTAKGLRSTRKRLSLSADELGILIGVTGQTVRSWESNVTHPRSSQLPVIAVLRKIGKREARSKLELLAAGQ